MVRAAREFAGASSEEIAALLGLNAATVRNGWREPVRGLGLVKRVLADARFGILVEGDLRRLSAWRRYAELT